MMRDDGKCNASYMMREKPLSKI